ncbi:hypothetical protein scyTo_0016746, partial [Scyliorhinus torazame]|nr:hypothetical protein [Scyliorhinus torazame]
DMIEDEFVKEVKAMKNINHPKIIKLLATCSIEEPIYIVTELMTKGNLQDYLRGDEGETLTVTHHVYMASQVADGMAYLERHKFVHRDLAARNVLVGEELTCKVADFGLARLIRDDVYHVRAGTKIPVKWTAPEAANYQRYSVKSDVWSFGILLYEMVTYGEEPYKGMTNKEVMDRVNDGYRMPCPENCSQDIYGIMLSWYAGKLSRSEAKVTLLSTQTVTGSFLIRESENHENGYALSVRDGDVVRHYRIMQNKTERFSLTAHNEFSSLKVLVEYYKLNNLRSGLRLTIPCQKQHQPDISDLSYLTVDAWERPRKEFTFTEKLGSGHFGEVYAGYWNKTVKVAIKTVHVGVRNQNDFQAETQVMKKLHHPYIMSLYAVCTTTDPFYIVTELMKNGSLLNYLRSKEGFYLSLEQLLDMTVQVAEGMSYLESQNYIHRDLAARNVLVGDNCTCKIADFGLARVVKDDVYVSQSATMPYKWTAPEAIEFGRFSVKSDVWSFGVLLYEIVTHGKTPYPGMENREVVSMVSKDYRMPCPDGCPEKLYEVMLRCWNSTAQNRPSFKALVQTLVSLNHYEGDICFSTKMKSFC